MLSTFRFRLFRLFLMALLLAVACVPAEAQTSFTYRGKLPVTTTAKFDLQFKLFSASKGGTQIGSTVLKSNVPVTVGEYTVTLDFGVASLSTGPCFLEVAYKVAGATTSYKVISTRDLITSVFSLLAASTLALRGVPLGSGAPSANQVLKYNGSEWVPAADISGPAYAAGAGLNLLDGVFSIAPGGVVSGMLADGAVTSAKLAWPIAGEGAIATPLLSLINTGPGLTAYSESNSGVTAISANARGLNARSKNDIAIWGESGGGNWAIVGDAVANGLGVLGRSVSAIGVAGVSSSNTGVYGVSTSGRGVHGKSSSDIGIWGETAGSNYALVADNTGAGPGILGRSTAQVAVAGQSAKTGAGVAGSSTGTYGLLGWGGGTVGAMGALPHNGTFIYYPGSGVGGYADNAIAISGNSTHGIAVLGGAGADGVGGFFGSAGPLPNGSAIITTSAAGTPRFEVAVNPDDAGTIRTFAPNGSVLCGMGAFEGFPNLGGVLVIRDGVARAAMYLNPLDSGRGTIQAEVKNFRIPNPRQPATDIVYACIEGPEAAAYTRGTGQLVNGRGVIMLPDHFIDVAVLQGMTVQLTPLSAESRGLAVVAKSLDSGIIVQELAGGRGTYQFDYHVTCVRKGHENYQVIQPSMIMREDGSIAFAQSQQDVDAAARAKPKERPAPRPISGNVEKLSSQQTSTATRMTLPR